ncbi:hypothetical protein CTEN210_14427 [Chaetoceros tenuissimus]|uniref:HMG box domain-containing protein n=1 Tax=Chaetoceros tenuissimus TaxID=426638 RepID=A0AAD3D774_9STRA|nr:hypothetical protein CTEN210_14427 [Chaetoceros tenuissimus]
MPNLSEKDHDELEDFLDPIDEAINDEDYDALNATIQPVPIVPVNVHPHHHPPPPPHFYHLHPPPPHTYHPRMHAIPTNVHHMSPPPHHQHHLGPMPQPLYQILGMRSPHRQIEHGKVFFDTNETHQRDFGSNKETDNLEMLRGIDHDPIEICPETLQKQLQKNSSKHINLEQDKETQVAVNEEDNNNISNNGKVTEVNEEEENDQLRFDTKVESEPQDPEVKARRELIEKTEAKSELEIALKTELDIRKKQVETLRSELIHMKNFVSRRRQKYKRKRSNDKAPRKAMSAYNLFMQDRFRKIAKENKEVLLDASNCKNMERVEASSLVTKTGHEWSKLSLEQRQVYEERAKADRERYEKEMDIYNPGRKNVRKRAKTAYNMFFTAHMNALKSKDKTFPSERGEAARIVGNAWKKLSSEDRQMYEESATLANEKMEREYKAKIAEEKEQEENEEQEKEKMKKLERQDHHHILHQEEKEDEIKDFEEKEDEENNFENESTAEAATVEQPAPVMIPHVPPPPGMLFYPPVPIEYYHIPPPPGAIPIEGGKEHAGNAHPPVFSPFPYHPHFPPPHFQPPPPEM